MLQSRIVIAAGFCVAFLFHSSGVPQNLRNSPPQKLSYPSSAAPLRIQNDVVAVQVRTQNDTIGGGEIRYTGLFNIGTPEDLPLLFQFPLDPFSSHVNIWVDGVMYSNDPFRTGVPLLALMTAPTIIDSTIECVYSAGLIEVTQRLTPKKFSRTTGGILIEYRLANRDPFNAHQVGVLLELDTFINGNDAASVLTSFGYSRNEQEFDAPAMPDFFQAFQGSLVSPGLVAQGTLVGFEAVRPDRLIIGDWQNLSRVQWDYNLSPQPYNDSAVLLRWNEKNLTPGEIRTVATYYGKGDVTTRTGPLTLHLTAPRNLQARNGQLTPNPFDVNLLVYNNSGTAANAVQATLRLPPGLALVSGEFPTKLLAPSNLNAGQNGTVTWKVLAQCPVEDIDLSMTVDVMAVSAANSVVRQILLPSCAVTLPNFLLTALPDSTTIIAGETRSFQINATALNGFNQSVQLSYFPPLPGMAGTFSPTTIVPDGTARFEVQTDRNLAAGEYRFLVTGTGGGLTRSDSVNITVHAAAPLDTVPPVLVNPFPADGATSVPLNTKISVEIYDPAPSAGVDQSSVRVFVNGAAVARTIVAKGTGYVVEHTPISTFRLNEVVRVEVVVSDLAQPANRDSIAFAFTTLQDDAPPYLSGQNPAAGATNVPLRTNVSVSVLDDLAGVDPATLVMAVDDSIRAPLITSVPKGYHLLYPGASPFRDDKRVNVVVRAGDLSRPPRAPSILRYSFTTVRDSLAPLVLEVQPNPNAVNVVRDVELRARLRDDLTGVDSAATRLWLNGKLVLPSLLRDGKDFVLAFKPFEPFSFNEVVHVRLVVADLAHEPNVDSTEYAFAIVEDRRPPFVTAHSPARYASNVPPKMPITFEVRDEAAGVDSSTIALRVNGLEVAHVLSGTTERYQVSFTPDPNALLRAGDTVYVEIAAADLARPANAMPLERYYYVLSRDRAAPFASGHNPPRNGRNVNLDTEVALDIHDVNPGVDSSSVRMRVNGAFVPLQLNRIENGFRVQYSPAKRFHDNQTVTVRVEAQDLAAPPNVMPADEYPFTTVRDSLPPVARDFSPRPFENNIPPQTEIIFTLEDDLTGVDSSAIVLQVNGNPVLPTVQRGAKGFTVRYDLSNQTLSGDTVRVRIGASDLAALPNSVVFVYHFVTSVDRTPPYLTGQNPAPEAVNVPENVAITATLVDDQSGVDLQSVEMEVNGQVARAEVSARGRALTLAYRSPLPFSYNEQVTVAIRAQDLAKPPNQMDTQVYRFTVVADTTPPFITDFTPPNNSLAVAPNTSISFSIHDTQAGVDSTVLRLLVNGERKAITLSGNAREYAVLHTPGTDLPVGQSIEVVIQARDLAAPPNTMLPRVFHFTTAEPLPDLIASDLHALEQFQLGRLTKLKGVLQRQGAVRDDFRVAFRADSRTLKDTTIAASTLGTVLELETSVLFENSGAHFVEMEVDAADEIEEADETNNRKQLPVQIAGTLAAKLTVRPNPFTPNGDGFNDEVEFNFAGLELENPTLHIFDVNGISIFLTNHPTGKRFTWNGRDGHGNAVQPGVYLYTLLERGDNVHSGYVVVAR